MVVGLAAAAPVAVVCAVALGCACGSVKACCLAPDHLCVGEQESRCSLSLAVEYEGPERPDNSVRNGIENVSDSSES